MKIIGQPNDYSDILQRIFIFSTITGLVSTILLAKSSPVFHEFVESIKTETDFGPVKSIKVLYVLIPATIALFSRIIKLHDRISDLFHIRFIVDTRFFLFPMCTGSGVHLDKAKKKNIIKCRNDAMYQTVYKYAGFKNPVIDEQIVRNAADDWGWVWVFVESLFLLSITFVIFLYLKKWNYAIGYIVWMIIQMILLLIKLITCLKRCGIQVKAILRDPERKNLIRDYFNTI